MKLNIGCGTKIIKGYVNLDIINLKGVDVVHDINKIPLPFPDNHFDEVYAKNILEHVKNVIEVMREINRILKKGGKLIFRVPLAYTFNDARIDHRWHFYPHTFFYFTKKTKIYEPQNNLCDFEFKIRKLWVTTPIIHFKFPYWMCFLNAFINYTFSGIEGIMVKE